MVQPLVWGQWDICVLLMHRESSCTEQLLCELDWMSISELPYLNLVSGFTELAFNGAETHEGHQESLAAAAATQAEFVQGCHTQFLPLAVSGAGTCGAVMLLQSAVGHQHCTLSLSRLLTFQRPRLWGYKCKTTSDSNLTLSGPKV